MTADRETGISINVTQLTRQQPENKSAPSRHGKERYHRDILLNQIIQP